MRVFKRIHERGAPAGGLRQTNSRSGFTLVELLVVIGIIGILAAILLPAMTKAFERAEIARARADVNAIETAVRAYLSEYGRFPHMSGNGRYTSDNQDLMNVLRAIDGSGNQGHQNNPRRIVFLELGEGAFLDDNENVTETAHDPWGEPYRVVVDLNFENECTAWSGETVSGRNVIVWSPGPDGEESGSGAEEDNVRSWR